MRPYCFTSSYERLSRVLANDVFIARGYGSEEPDSSVVWGKYIAIWDTGATNTVITPKVVQECNLKPTGMTRVNHGGGTQIANTYLVNVRLPNHVEMPQIRVAELPIVGQTDVLIGMDIIGLGDFAVTNKGKTVFSFRMPSVDTIDFVKQPYRGTPVRTSSVVGRNDPCPCGSGKKYKHCCMNKGK